MSTTHPQNRIPFATTPCLSPPRCPPVSWQIYTNLGRRSRPLSCPDTPLSHANVLTPARFTSFSLFRGDQSCLPGRYGRNGAQRARRHDGLVHGAACAQVGQGRAHACRRTHARQDLGRNDPGQQDPDLRPDAPGRH